MRKIIILLVICMITILSGCTMENSDNEKLKDLEFTVLDKEEIPQELIETIDGKKNTEFKTTYEDNGSLYICVGYGEQSTGGYSISVNDVYLTSNAVYVNTSLLGPENDEKVTNEVSYPYIVIKMEYVDKNVVFE